MPNTSFCFFCACLLITPLLHFLFLPLNATEKTPQTYKTFHFKEVNSQEKNLAEENNLYFDPSCTQSCQGGGTLTISLPQRCRFPGARKGTPTVSTVLAKPFGETPLTSQRRIHGEPLTSSEPRYIAARTLPTAAGKTILMKAKCQRPH